ncbi:hypothetical protein BGW38_002341 [Lunasporangiospora selenospora]|uniref:Uncharacterized protein n=1 Tax=Lunasporangiospora selenospora TaxID=979761 RepID=A0A9P6G128_9FUNG|nr:hypothetical protein BGW38_002341 [Lunasporangiospora selenospora]
MQFKTLALAAIAAVAVSAQDFESNPCSVCVFGTIAKDTVCAALPPAKLKNITDAFGATKIDATPLVVGSKDPEIKACLCSWAKDAFSGTGPTATCTSTAAGGNATCAADQITEGKTKMAPLVALFQCGTATGNNTNGNNTKPTTAAASSIKASHILAVAAVGAAAFFGL